MNDAPEQEQTESAAVETLAVFPNRRTIEHYAMQYRFVLPDRQAVSRMGELSGRRTGSSIEYQDRKDYVPGDDPRHIDWRAYARNDRLTVKLYREEISPTFDIIVDTSRSMAVTDAKSTRRLDLTYLCHLLARKLHGVVRLHSLGDRIEPMFDPLDMIGIGERRQDDPMPSLQAAPMARRGGVKILISDLLFPFAPSDLVATFSAADRLVLIQVLSEFEDDPQEGASVRLEDAESGQWLDVALDRTTVNGYKHRLERMRADLDRCLKISGGALAMIRDTDPLDAMIHKLLTASVIGV